MSIEGSTLEALGRDVERERFSMSLYDLRMGAQASESIEDRELRASMCDDLADYAKRYTEKIARFMERNVTSDTDEARRRAHDALLSQLNALTRSLGGPYRSWWESPKTTGGLDQGNRQLVGAWAVIEGLEQLRGELLGNAHE